VVTDKNILATGLVDAIIGGIQGVGLPYVLYDGVVPDPTDTCIDEGAKIALAEKVDGIIAIGGGSSMDTGKCINLLLNNPMPIKQYFVPAMPEPVNHPMITIPTTAGSGAECTAGAIITNTEAHVKVPIARCGVKYIFIDPEMYVGLPLKPSIYCGFDALTHDLDLMTSRTGEELTCVLTEKSTALIAEYLPKVFANPKDMDARTHMAMAATLAGECLNTDFNGTHYSHSIGHSLGAALHIQHGLACGVAVPQILERLADISPVPTRRFCDAMGFGLDPKLHNAAYGKQAKACMQKFMKGVGIPNLKEQGFTLEQILDVIPMMLTDIITVFGWPAQLDADDFKEILTEAYDQ
ncbi:MAG: iron-containing alcohol dehydrogenase, partial [Oscillibacter sp.]